MILVLAFSFGGGALLSAQEGAPSPEEASPEAAMLLDESPGAAVFTGDGTSSAFSAVLRMVLVLILVAAFIYLLVFLMKRFLKGIARPRDASNPSLKVLATAHLGANRFVHVLSLGPKAWLVGSAEGAVSLIAELDDKETVDTLLLDASRSGSGQIPGKFADFRSFLRRFGGGGGSGPAAGEGGPAPENIRKRRERLRGL